MEYRLKAKGESFGTYDLTCILIISDYSFRIKTGFLSLILRESNLKTNSASVKKLMLKLKSRDKQNETPTFR